MQSLDRILEGHFKQRWWQAWRGLSNVHLSGNFMEDYLTIREAYNKPYYGLDISSPAIEIFNLILDNPDRFSCHENCHKTLTDEVTEVSFTFTGTCLLINHDAFTKTEVEIFQEIFRQWCKTHLKTPRKVERERLTKIYCKEK